MPRRTSASTQYPRGAAKYAASVTGLLLAALALTACGNTQLPKAGECIDESATVTGSIPDIVDCKSDDAVSKVVEVDTDPDDHAGQDSIAEDLCEGHSGGEALVITETEKKKSKKKDKNGKKRTITETENDWAACVVKA